jgi:chromate transporter
MTDLTATTTATAAPRSPADLFWAFNRLALQGFGGVLPVAQRELVERLGWLNRTQFLELLSLSQVLPGPNIVNLGLIMGDRAFGLRGALAAVAGMLLGPLILILVLAVAAVQWRDLPAVGGALRGMGIVAGALVLSTALKLAHGLKGTAMGLPLATLFVALTALAIGWLRWPLVFVVLGLGVLGWSVAWWRVGK